MLLDEPTSAQPPAAIGEIMAGVGLLLLVIVLVLGIMDLAPYLLRASRKGCPGPRRRHPQPGQRTGQSQGAPPLGERTVKVLMVGYSASGKTLMLAGLYHYFSHGTRAGIRFITDDESNRSLVNFATAIRDHRNPLPPGTQETKRWQFAVRVESGDQQTDAFTLEYLDYPGGFIDRMLNSPDPSLAAELDPELKDELKSTDVLMGVLDGERLVKLMVGDYDAGIVGDIERLLNILIRTDHRNIHLVITKWDLMRGAGGAHYTISDVRAKLDQVSTAFQNFRESPRLEASLRIIPVSALGVNGFAASQPGKSWRPWNVQVPFFSAVPDTLASDVPTLAERREGPLSKIGLVVFSIAGLIEVGIPLGVIDLKVPTGEVIQKVMAFVRERNQRGQTPVSLTAESALSYVLNESYAALHDFEERMPDSRV